MSIRSSILALSVLALMAVCAGPAQATHLSCGQTITTDAVLDNDLDCSGGGLVVGADDITLDLNGHLMNGHFGSSVGIDNSAGHDGVQIQNGFVSRFGTGIKIANAERNRVADVTIMHGLGLELTDSQRCTLTDLLVDSGFIEVLLTRSSENVLTGIRDTLVRIDDDSDRNRIEGNTRGKVLVTAGSDDNAVVGNHEYQVDIRTSARATVVGNDARSIEFESVRDSRIANNDIIESAHPIGVRLAMSNTNVIEDNRVVDQLPTGIPGGSFARSALLIFGSSDNRVIRNDFSRYEVGIEMTGDANRNVVSENVISGHDASGMRLYLADENSIESNELSSNGQYGIEFQLAADQNRIERNTIVGSGIDGVNISAARSAQNLIQDNTVGVSGDDGIDIDAANNTVTANSAHDNADWGIEAIAGTTDGGGNRAWSNGQAAQCLNVSCTPFPPSERCRVKGKGTIAAANGDDATFDIQVHATGHGRPAGRLTYRDGGPADRLTARSARIDAVTCTADTASVFGTARVTGSRDPVRFRVDLEESPDTYRIRLDGRYDSGPAAVSSGKIRIQ